MKDVLLRVHPEAWQALQSEIGRLREMVEAARQFVARHPALTDADRAEFEAFLKVPDAIRIAMSN